MIVLVERISPKPIRSKETRKIAILFFMIEKAKVLEVLGKVHLMSLATVDAEGVWVADVIFIYDEDLNIYWMSHPDARHSRAILEHAQVAGTITLSTQSKEMNLGIQFAGNARKIDGARHDLAVKHYKKRNHPVPSEDEDVLKGRSWYVITPTRIDLIDEARFGSKKVRML